MLPQQQTDDVLWVAVCVLAYVTGPPLCSPSFCSV